MPKTKKYITLDMDEEDTSLDRDITQKKTMMRGSYKPSDLLLTNRIGGNGSLVTSVPKPQNATIFKFNPYSPRGHNQYYVSEVVRAMNERNSLAM